MKRNKIKNISFRRKQNKKVSQNNKKFIKDTLSGKGFRSLE